MKITINLNDSILVSLGEKGLDLLRDAGFDMEAVAKYYKQEDGRYKLPLYEFMYVFGKEFGYPRFFGSKSAITSTDLEIKL